jgi:phage shock protein C
MTNRIILLQEADMEHRLYRSQRNRIVLGVCGGLGEYFNIDPVIIRVITVVIIIASGVFPGLVAYLIMALVIPTAGSTAATPRDSVRENVDDMRNTASNIGEEIRTTFENKETKTNTVNEPHPISSQPASNNNKALFILGIIIIAIGVIFVVGNVFGWFFKYLWPILLIAAGVIIILMVRRRPKN